jgi:hypothetical protein
MIFTHYRVEADYLSMRGDVIGPGAICRTMAEAQELADQWRGRSNLKNVRIIVKGYG